MTLPLYWGGVILKGGYHDNHENNISKEPYRSI